MTAVAKGCTCADCVCPRSWQHTKSPHGYLAKAAWAEEKVRTHEQTRCPDCGRLAIWKPKPTTAAG